MSGLSGRAVRLEAVAYAVLFRASEGAELYSAAVIDLNGASSVRS